MMGVGVGQQASGRWQPEGSIRVREVVVRVLGACGIHLAIHRRGMSQ